MDKVRAMIFLITIDHAKRFHDDVSTAMLVFSYKDVSIYCYNIDGTLRAL